MADEYHAYLLRLWRVEEEGGRWRAQLEEVGTGERHGFASMEELTAFLEGLGEVKKDAEQGSGSNQAEGENLNAKAQ